MICEYCENTGSILEMQNNTYNKCECYYGHWFNHDMMIRNLYNNYFYNNNSILSQAFPLLPKLVTW